MPAVPDAPRRRLSRATVLLITTAMLVGLGFLGVALFSEEEPPPPTAGLDADTTANANTNTDGNTQDFTHPTAGYTLRFPQGWQHTSGAGGTIDTFAPAAEPPLESCFLRISSRGLLGRGIALKRGPVQSITVTGVSVTKRTWLTEDGILAYYAFELQKSGQLIGVEGYVGTTVTNCAAILDDIVASFNLDEHTTPARVAWQGIAVTYPGSWMVVSVPGAAHCRGFTSPALLQFRQASANRNVGGTDAPIAYDVTLCNEGPLDTTLSAAAQRWIDGTGADDVSVPRENDPIPGALRYTLTVIRQFDAVFIDHHGILVSATLERLPYPSPSSNAAQIVAMLRSLE